MTKRKNKVIVNFVLDETASMHVVKDATISGFNEYIETLKKDEKSNILLTLTKFNSDKVDTVYTCEPIKKIENLSDNTYQPNSMTPLYDAIGRTVRETEKKVKSMRGKPSVLCVIQTDGEENCSMKYDLAKIRSLIAEKERDGWTFVYLGADQNAWKHGGMIGISKGNTMSYSNNPQQTRTVYAGMAGATLDWASSSITNSGQSTDDLVLTSLGTTDIRGDNDHITTDTVTITTTDDEED